jgi:hypothetical protein
VPLRRKPRAHFRLFGFGDLVLNPKSKIENPKSRSCSPTIRSKTTRAGPTPRSRRSTANCCCGRTRRCTASQINNRPQISRSNTPRAIPPGQCQQRHWPIGSPVRLLSHANEGHRTIKGDYLCRCFLLLIARDSISLGFYDTKPMVFCAYAIDV